MSITLTEHGIAHVLAQDWRSLGYGEGYALARNDLCAIADAIATYSGRRALRYGVAGSTVLYLDGRSTIPNAEDDLVQRFLIDEHLVERARAGMSARARALVDGFAAGYDAYAAALPRAERPEACRAKEIVRPITADDVIRRIYAFAILEGGEHFRRDLLAAKPTSGERNAQAISRPAAPLQSRLGSNALAIGRDLTTNGSGLLLANPHFVWEGPERFVEIHLTIPGHYDAMGAAVTADPAILIGFNKALAWTHTISTDAHAALYRLKLDPADPTRYLVDGRSIPMQQKRVVVPTRDARDRVGTAEHVFWTTRFGPVIANAQKPWTRAEAWALADPNRGNVRVLDENLDIGRARRIDEVQASLSKSVGSSFVNTIAADADGEVLFTDMAPTLGFEADKYKACMVRPEPLYWQTPTFDGSGAACAPTGYPDAPQAGVLPGRLKPSLVRTDYVENSNDSYWLTNANQPLEGFSPIIGRERAPQRERQRTAHLMVRERISGADGLPGDRFDRKTLETLLFRDRNLTAELTVDDLVAACRTTPVIALADGTKFDLSHACDVLSRWDRRNDLQSVGAPLFKEFAYQAKDAGLYPDRSWRVPFDVKDPVGTPYGLADDPALLRCLALAVKRLDNAAIAIDAPLGQVQSVERNGRRIPIHGGPTMTSYDAIDAELVPGVGYTNPSFATSYIQVVGFGPQGPEADAVLASSQSSDPTSPFYADQTEMYSKKLWLSLPFTPEAIATHAIAPPLVLRAPPPRPKNKTAQAGIN